MTVDIIVEDGSIVSGANSYVSTADVRNFCSIRGITLPDSDDDVASLLILAADYISQFAANFPGERVSDDQVLDWPRCERFCGSSMAFPVTTAYGYKINPAKIPRDLVSAQCFLVGYQAGGVDLTATISASDYITEDTIGPITTKYSDPSKLSMREKMPYFDSLLSRLYSSSSGGGGITVVRV